MLKKENNISTDKIIICELFLMIFVRSLSGKKPPDDIKLNAKFNELKVLTENIFKTRKIINVRKEYSKKILIACLKISLLSNER